MATNNNCELCGEPMPPGEEMFNFHGYSGPCPKPPLPRQPKLQPSTDAQWREYYETKCRKQREEIAKLTELIRRAQGALEMYSGGQRPRIEDVEKLIDDLELDPRQREMMETHKAECEELFRDPPAGDKGGE